MNKNDRLQGFRALLTSDKSNSYYLEETNGDRRLWKDLSAEGRLEYIASAAAMYNVPFEKFVEAVQESIGKSAVAYAALRMVLSNAHELRGLAKLLPDDGRTESTPLIDRFKEILRSQPGPLERYADHIKEATDKAMGRMQGNER